MTRALFPSSQTVDTRRPREEYEEFKRIAYKIADERLEHESQQVVQLWLNDTLRKLWKWSVESSR